MPKLLIQNLKLVLISCGLVLLALGNAVDLTYFKVDIGHLLGEVGSLLLVVGFLHFLIDLRLREEMIRDISSSILGNQRIHDGGVRDCILNSKEVKDPEHWEATATLTIGLEYSSRLIEDNLLLLQRRGAANRQTHILVMDPSSAAAIYLKESKTGIANVAEGVERIRRIIDEANKDLRKPIAIKMHDRVLRYSFIRTDESIWIKFYANAVGRVTIPALKVGSGSPLYKFFNEDIDRLLGQT